MTVKVTVDKGRPKFSQMSKGQKSVTAMVHEIKTKKYPVSATCQNVSCLLLQIKFWLKKGAVSVGPK